MTKESDIVFTAGEFTVRKSRVGKHPAYGVFREGATHAVSDSFYTSDSDGLSLAKARCKYLNCKTERMKS